jgi:hypothetical protein
MENFKQCICLLLLVTVVFSSCKKENIANNNNQQASNANVVPQSVVYNNITIDPSANHVFTVPYLTQAVIDKGSLTIYAADVATQTPQWQVLSSCEAHIDISSITVGNVEIQNNMSSSVSMSFRFDVPGN